MKKFLCIEVLFIIAVLFSGCGFHITKPERIGIKTSDEAVYNLSIADKKFELGDFFDVNSLLKSTENEENNSSEVKYKVFEYDPETNGDKFKQFLLKMDLQSISLNPGESLNNTDITVNFGTDENGESNSNFTMEIPIPDVNKTEEIPVNFDANEKINNLVKLSGATSQKSDVDVLFSNEKNGFDGITYKSGYMTIYNSPETTEKIIGSIVLRNRKTGTKLSEADFIDGVAELPLDEVKIEKDNLSFEFSDSVGVPFIAEVKKGSIVKSVSNLTIEDPIPVTVKADEGGISLGSISKIDSGNDSVPIKEIESYEIGEGTLKILFNLPPQWEKNEQVLFDYTMTLSDAINAKLTKEEPEYPLSGEVFYKDSKLDYEVAGNFHLNHATLSFIEEVDGEEKTIKPTVSVDVSISVIEEAVMSLDPDNPIKMPEPENVDLDTVNPDITKNVKAILWDRCGFSISYINTLPAENKITINSTSDFFNLKKLDNPVVLVPTEEKEGLEPKETELNDFVNVTTEDKEYKTLIGHDSENGELSVVDVDAEINISGYDKDNNKLTMKKLAPGKTYKIDFKITPVLEWNTMWIDTANRHESDSRSTGLNLSSVFDSMEESIGSDIANNLEFERVPIYLFAETPVISGSEENEDIKEFFDNVKFNGIIKAYIGDDNKEPVEAMKGKEKYLLGTKKDDVETKQDLTFRKGLNLNIVEDKVVTTDVEIELGVTQAEKEKGDNNIADLLNYRDEGSLCVSYDIGFQSKDKEGQIALTKKQLELLKGKGSTTISLSVLCLIPMEFNVKSDIYMNILKLVGVDKGEENFDLLGRTEDPDYTKVKEYAKAIKNVQIIYEPSKLPFIVQPEGSEDEMSLVVDMDGDKEELSPQLLKITGDSLQLTPDDILRYPLCPTIQFLIPKGKLIIPQELVLDTKLFLKVATSGEIIWLDSFKAKEEGGDE